jgi:K+-transporting ATPase ATPase A chain
MSFEGLLQIVLYLIVLTALVPPLGAFMAAVFEGRRTWLSPVVGPLERGLCRAAGVDPATEQHWTRYALALLVFNLAGLLIVYAIQRLQPVLPLNPAGLPAVPPDLAFNTAVSFATNTNWQSYGGETTLSYLTQMAALTVQNFVSAATGIAVLLALARGFARREAATVGNFWADLVRGTLHLLLPLSIVFALFLVWQGVPQTLDGPVTATTLEGATQTIAQGPAASQIAIKQLGTNGGGFFNANAAHPFENPTPLSNILQCLAILLIPAALTFTFGTMVGDRRQGWALYAAMMVLLVAGLAVASWAEAAGNPLHAALGVDPASGNMEGKEVRFGIAASVLWAVATSAASNGSVNAMLDSFTPLGGLVPMVNIMLGEVIFGGVGSGLYGLLVYAVLAVFVAGLMVGRTPEYLGKKIEAKEMTLAVLAFLTIPVGILVGTAVALQVPSAVAGIQDPGAHGFSEMLYAFTSATGNNGSAFAGLTANVPFTNTALGLAMLLGRYFFIVPVLAIAGALAAKKVIPASAGTFPTHGPLFVGLLIGTILVLGGLTFFPALALGPVVEHLQLVAGRTF